MATGTPIAGWIPLGQASTADVIWSPDSAHVLVALGTAAGPPETNVVNLLDQSGQLVRSFEAVRMPVWIDSQRFLVHQSEWAEDDGEWTLVTSPDGHLVGEWKAGTVSSDDLGTADVPSWPAVSNGRGALAFQQFGNAGRPETIVWSDGTDSDALEGRLAGWSNDGARLALIRPPRSGPADEGPFEVLGWPGLESQFLGAESESVGNVLFNPAGDRVAYATYRELPHQPRQLPDFELTLNLVELTTGDETTLVATENGGFEWLDDDHVLVVGYESLRATIYGLDGSVADAGLVAGPDVLRAANGSALVFYDDELDEPSLQVMHADAPVRDLDSPGAITGAPPAVAPDGSGLIVIVRQPGGPQNPPATVLLHAL